MKHRDLAIHLPEFGMGVLDPGTEAAVATHVSRCSECQEWLETRDLLAEGVGGTGEPADHPDAALLALCVVRPEEVQEPGLEELRRHLERCSTCRQEVGLMSRATQAARPRGETGRRDQPPTAARVVFSRTAALAAALATLLAGAAVVVAMMKVDPSPAEREGEAARILAPEPGVPARPPAPAERLSGEDLDGARVIRTEGTLAVSRSTVNSGADVTLEAGELVVFENGFRVAEGGRLTVISGRTDASQPKKRGPGERRAAGKG